MLVGVQMVLAVLVVALAFGAEAKLQGRIVQLRAAADGAPVPGSGGSPVDLMLEVDSDRGPGLAGIPDAPKREERPAGRLRFPD